MPIGFFMALAINAVFFVLGELLRPKPDFEDAEALPFEEARLPQINPERKQTVGWGNFLLTAPHLMDVTEYNTVAIKTKIKTSIFSSTKVIVGHRYFFGVQLGLIKGPAVLRRIFYDDVEIWNGTSDATADTTGYVIDLDLPTFLGGTENGGGIVGRFRFFSGSPTHLVDPYLASFQNPAPAYRWTSFITMENVEVGETPNIEAFSYEIERYPNPLGLSAGNLKIGLDINPMSIVAECFTDDDWGFNRPSEINVSSLAAVAAVLKTEGNGISLKWVSNLTIDRIIDIVNKQVDGVLRYNPKTGLWEYKLLRDDYTFGSLPIFSKSAGILEMNTFSRANWSETVNNVEITYNQRNSPEKPAPATAQDRRNFVLQGSRHKTLRLSMPGCYSSVTAQNLASRELRTNGFPFSTAQFNSDRTAWDMLPGDPFRLQWEDNLGIVDLVMRVGSIGFGDLEQTEIQIGAIEDVFALADNVFAAPPASLFVGVNPAPTAVVTFAIQDQNYFFALRDDERTDVPLDEEKPLILASKPQSNSLNMAIEARIGTDPFAREAFAGYLPSGTLQAAIFENTGDISQGVEMTSLVVENMIDAALLESIAIDDDMLVDGLNLAILISTVVSPFTAAVYEAELISYESVTLDDPTTVTLGNIHRALGDTQSVEAAIGDRIFFVTGAQIDGPATTLRGYADTATVDLRLINIATSGEAAPTADQAELLRNRVSRPWPARNFAVESIRYPSIAFALDTSFTIAWLHNDKAFSGALLGELWFQDATAPTTLESGFEYKLEIYNDITDALLRIVRPSGSTNTPDEDDTLTTATTYEYSLAKQQADGGPFARYRIEITVEESVAGAAALFSLLTVYRVFQVVIPVSLTARGPIYHSLAAVTPADVYPMTGELEFSGEFEELSTTVLGTQVGANAPGPSPIITGVTIPGDNAADADWTGNLDIPDGSLNTFDRHVGYVSMFHFKLVKDGQTNKRYIISKDNAANINTGNWRTLISSTGIWEDQYNLDDDVQNDCVDSLDWEDGRWHQACVFSWRIASNNQRRAYMIDGVLLFRANDGFAPSTSTVTASVGGPDAAETASFGWAKFFMAQLMSKVGYTPELEGGDDDEFIMHAQSDGMQRSPWQMQALGMFKDAWMRGGVGDDTTSTMGLPDFSGNAVQTNIQYAPDNQDWVIDAAFQVGFTKVGTTPANGITVGPIADAWSYKTDMIDGATVTYLQIPTDYWNATPVGSATSVHVNTDALWPKLFAMHCIINADNFTTVTPLLSVAAERIDASETDQGHQFSIWIETDGRINISVETDNSNHRVHQTNDVCCATGIDLHISVFNVDTTGWEVWVNGREYTVDNAFSTAGTPPAIDDWMNARPGGSLTSSMRPRVYNWGDENPPTATAGIESLDGRHMEWGAVKDETWSGGDHILLYAASFKGFPTMKDIIMDWSPYNAYQILANTAEDLRGQMGTVTATGAFTTDEECPIAAWDLTLPLRFQDTVPNRLEYTVHFLDGKGTGLIDDFSLVCIGQIAKDTVAQTLFTNYNAGNETNFSLNYSTASDRLEFLTTGGSAIIGELGVTGGDPICAVLTHFDDGGTDRWNWWQGKDCGQPAAEVTTANAYSGAAITDGRIGDDDGLVAPLDGMVHYISAFDRTITPEHARRICLAYRGFTGALLEIHKHIDDTEANAQPGFLYPLDERDMSVMQAENWVINNPLIQNLTLNGVGIVQAKGLATCGHGRFPTLASATYLEGPSPNFAAAYPLTIGVQVRVDSGTDAMVAIADGGSSDNFIAIGIVSGKAAIRFDATAITGPIDEAGTTSVTAGEFATVSVTFESNTVRRLYLNNKLEATFTTSYALATMIGALDTVGVNRIPGLGTNFDGSYQILWGVQADLNSEAHMIIHAAHRPFGWEAVAGFKDDVPNAQWLLNEPVSQVSGVYRDQFNDDYAAVDVSTGVTQGQIGIVPGRMDICCDFDGANGGIDTNFLAYETGTNNRAFECWLEAGFTGTVWSMGANVDAQAIVVSVDGSGDVSIHIRGAGNERIWTTAIDAGTEHHLLIMLDGDSLHDFQVWIDGIEQTTISTAGTDTVLGTVATLDFHIADDITDVGKTDGNGKMYGVTVYNLGASGVITDADITLRNNAGRAVYSGVSW